MTNQNRITATLAALKSSGKKALVSYIVAGDPTPETSLPAMHALVESGTDIIELGIPFSDPMAEGPVIQKAHERALVHNTSLRDTLNLIKEFRKTDTQTPVVVMGYVNPIERIGYAVFAAEAAAAGVDGVITVDLPPEELDDFNAALKTNNIHNIFLLAPTTNDERIAKICAVASGFLYYVSLKGVTGAGHLDIDSVEKKLAAIRQHSDLPVLVGFGIKNAETAKAVGELADGVVVGSVLVNAMAESAALASAEICKKIQGHVASIRSGLDAAS